MANPFSIGWKYAMAKLDATIDDNADPMVQIQQATDAAKKQHQAIVDQASAVLGNQRQIEMKLNRLIKDQEKLQSQAQQALHLADTATQSGDSTQAREWTSAAEVVASQLVSVEQQIEDMKQLHRNNAQAVEQATHQVHTSEARLTEQLGQIDQLRAQVNHTKMHEESAKATESMNALTAGDDSVPSLDAVRDKIERRYADALGAQELTKNSIDSRLAEIETAGRDLKASARLEEIRAHMGAGNSLSPSDTPPELGTATHHDAAATHAATTEHTATEADTTTSEEEKDHHR